MLDLDLRTSDVSDKLKPMKFELKQLNNNIFVLSVDDTFTLAMTFLRWSEYTEWPDPKIKGQCFSILEFIESYSRANDGVFSYPTDWVGFNIPSKRFSEYPFGYIKDKNKYDEFMESVVTFIKTNIGKAPFYLIGHMTGSTDVVDHEIAHAMYDRMSKYKAEMKKLTIAMPDKRRDEILNCIAVMGYSEEVLEDELQAYLSTGLSEELQELGLKKKMLTEFVDVFEKYKGILMNGE